MAAMNYVRIRLRSGRWRGANVIFDEITASQKTLRIDVNFELERAARLRGMRQPAA
jgi:hypothetical protein